MPRKKKELVYTAADKVKRWNLCQQISHLLYSSDRSDEDLEYEIDELESEIINKYSK